MIISEKTIFYFSGTGNSLQVSKDIAKQLGDTELISIPKIIDNNEIKVEAEFIGIVFPVYMGGLPLLVENFMKKLKIDKTTYVFAVSTYGGMAGSVLEQVSHILEDKNVKLNAGLNIKMPGNYIVMYGAKTQENQNKAFEIEKIKVKEIVDTIKAKKALGFEKNNSLIGKVIGPLMDRKRYEIHTKDKLFLAKDNCTGCGVCEKICGVANIEIKEGKPVWKNKCEQCMACIQYCPKEAIEYGKKTIGRKRYRNPNVKVNELLENQ